MSKPFYSFSFFLSLSLFFFSFIYSFKRKKDCVCIVYDFFTAPIRPCLNIVNDFAIIIIIIDSLLWLEFIILNSLSLLKYFLYLIIVLTEKGKD